MICHYFIDPFLFLIIIMDFYIRRSRNRLYTSCTCRNSRFLNNFKADKIILVPSDTFTNKGFIKWPQVAFKLLLGFFISLFWIILTRPILSIGFGGYPSLSPLLASKLLGRKIIIHEQNTVFGRANNFLCSFADGVSNGFKNTIEEAYDGKVIKKGWGGYIEEKGYLD